MNDFTDPRVSLLATNGDANVEDRKTDTRWSWNARSERFVRFGGGCL
jgi:hypothetical protein